MYAIESYGIRLHRRYVKMNLRLLLLITLISTVKVADAQLQRRHEVGGGIGAFNYTGDLVRTYNPAFSRFAGTVFYRNNISPIVSLRTTLSIGSIGANDQRKPIDPAALVRDASFKLSMMEFAPVFEYHFFDWRTGRRPIPFTPYLFSGAALFLFSGNKEKPADYSNVQLAIPFGGGGKVVLNPYWYLAVEFGIRKTFFDYLDNVSGADPAFKTFQYGNPYDKDNYFFAGITLTRTFYEIPCATSPYR